MYTAGSWLLNQTCESDCQPFGKIANDANNTCLSSCPGGRQSNQTAYWRCTNCPVNCSTCVYANNCTYCSSGSWLLLNT